jgi:signal transduction histidine kinase/ActR/RegA family two-component response regulator
MTSDLLNPATASASLSVLVSLAAAAGARFLGRAPDWGDVRPLGAVGLTAGLAAACNLPATLAAPVWVHAWSGRLQILVIALHVAAWYAYLSQWSGREPARLRLALAPLVLAGVAALVPGAVYAEAVRPRAVAWLGVVYHDPVVTPTGAALYSVILGYGVAGLVLAARAGRAALPYPRAHLGIAAATLLMGLHDAVVIGGLSAPTPYLLDFAFYGPMAVLATVTLRRVVASAKDLHALRAGLADAVVDRSRKLDDAQAALARSERLAALGRFSAGFAHEVNNPAAVVQASLDHLSRALRDDPRDEVWSSLQDARAALRRVSALAAQLLVAGRAAWKPRAPRVEVRAGRAAEHAIMAARARGPAEVEFRSTVPAELTVLGDEDGLVQILSNLAVNAVQAVPAGRAGTVVLRAEEAGDRVRLVVEDDGAGMSEEALQHLFEPFYSTKPPGVGSGLGLAVSRGLAEDMGGSLRLESEPGVGTLAILELERGTPAALGAARPAAPAGEARRRRRVLVVDDDALLLRAVTKLLALDHDVVAASGVFEGLAALQRGPFELVLCDVMMPLGGGERFWEELLLRAPDLRERVVFMTGGAATAEARAFLDRQPRPVLQKPFDIADVEVLLARLRDLPPPATSPAAPGDDARRAPEESRPIGKLRR